MSIPSRPKTRDADLLRAVREEIRQADEALVRDWAALRRESAGAWENRDVVRHRIALGLKVAACKFQADPERFRALARARDERGLEHAITDVRMEEAVLERVRSQARELGCSDALAERMAAFYRDRIIPETKKVQIRRLCELA